MNEQYAGLITSFPLFAGYTAHGAQFILDKGAVQEYASGTVIFHEGDPAEFVLLVLAGSAEVYVERSGRVLSLVDSGPGTILGEIAVLCGIPRSASLRAREKLVVVRWTADAFRQMLLSNVSLSQRILRHSLRTLIDKEQALINSLGSGPGAA